MTCGSGMSVGTARSTFLRGATIVTRHMGGIGAATCGSAPCCMGACTSEFTVIPVHPICHADIREHIGETARKGSQVSIVIVRRPERRPAPKPPRGEILLESPPEIPEVQPQGFMNVLTYLPMVAGGAAMALMFTTYGNSNPIMYVASGLFAFSMLA